MIKNFKDKNKAQTMVEFALVLPILMLIVFGLLEVGRLVFVYVSIASASREAVRYGSATGVNNTAQNINKYRDCAGIRAAAQNVDFLNSFTDNDILIEYYHANSTTRFSTCPVGGLGPAVISNGDRIYVHIQGNFEPVVSFIPLLTRTVANGNPITSQNFHTLIGSADIPITWFRPGDSSGTGEEPCYNCFEPNTDVCPNLTPSDILPNNYFRDWLGNCYPNPVTNDYCSNLPGKQKTMPVGYYYDPSFYPSERKCVALNSGDVCPNIEGIQTDSVLYDPELNPNGTYILDITGYCVIDYCKNIDGIQYAIPSSQWYDYVADDSAIENRTCTPKPACGVGTVFDLSCYVNGYDPDNDGIPNISTSDCCVAITDYCTNIAGPQDAIPPGYTRDLTGKCFPIPVCRYSSSGEVPLKIVEGSTTNEPTIWYIKNETGNPIRITYVYITWDLTNSDLSLQSLYFGSYKINNGIEPDLNISGYEPLTNGESIIINGNETLQVGLTYKYDMPAPETIDVATEIMVRFGTDKCYFGPDPDEVLPDQPTCGDPTNPNVLESYCAAQHN